MKFVQILLVHRDGRIRALRIPCNPDESDEVVLDQFDPADLTGNSREVFDAALDAGFCLAGFGGSIVEMSPANAAWKAEDCVEITEV